MPFNSELESFAKAFSSGYSMTKSKEEREAERLALEKGKLEVGRLPTQYAHEDETHAIEMERARGEITDAEAARRQKALLNPIEVQQAQETLKGTQTQTKLGEFALERAPVIAGHEDVLFGQDKTIKDAQIAEAKHAAERLPTVERQQDEQAATSLADAKELLETHKEVNTPEMKQARKDVAEAEVLTAKANARIAQEGATDEALAQKREAIQAEIDAHKAAMAASESTRKREDVLTEGAKTENRKNAILLEEQEAKHTLFQGLLDSYNSGNTVGDLPAENQPHAVDAEPTSPTAPATGTTPGPQSAVDVPLPPGSPAGSEAFIATHDDTAVPEEAPTAGVTPEGNALTPVPPPAPLPDASAREAVDSSGVTGALGQQAAAAASPARKQQVIDTFISGKDTLPNGKHVLDEAGDLAVIDGLTGMVESHGLNQDNAVETPETEDQSRGFLTGKLAASPDAVEMIEKTVQERAGKKLSQNQLTYKTLATGWLFNNAMGDPEEAKKYAQALTSHYQMVFGQYVAMAHASAEAGDHEHTANALERAYANVPTNDELTIRPTKDGKHYIAKITDSDGNVTEQQIMTPEEMGAYAMKIDPSSFVSLISQAAGREDKTISQAAAEKMGMPGVAGLTEEQARISQAEREANKGKPLSQDDLTKAHEDVTASLDSFVEANPKFEEFFNNEETGRRADLQTVTEQLYQNNLQKLNPRDAAAVTMNILTGGLSKPPVMTDDNPMVTINVPGQRPLELPKEQYMTLVTLREMGQFRGPVENPPAPTKSWSDYIPGLDAAPAEAVSTAPGSPAYSPRFNAPQALPSGPGPGPLETIFGYINQPAPEKSRMPSRAVGSQDRKPEIKYRRGTQPPRR